MHSRILTAKLKNVPDLNFCLKLGRKNMLVLKIWPWKMCCNLKTFSGSHEKKKNLYASFKLVISCLLNYLLVKQLLPKQ